MKGYWNITRVILLTVTVVMLCFAIGLIWVSREKESLIKENTALKQQLGQVRGKPVLVESLPDGDYDRLDMSAGNYIFLRRQGCSDGAVVGVRSESWRVPDHFAWKDGRLISFR